MFWDPAFWDSGFWSVGFWEGFGSSSGPGAKTNTTITVITVINSIT